MGRGPAPQGLRDHSPFGAKPALPFRGGCFGGHFRFTLSWLETGSVHRILSDASTDTLLG
jgi:hypothetical protein